jgi:L-serine/L-threonine ammonia-lyase
LILHHLSDPSSQGKKLHFYSSSGGNAGLAAVIAARDLGCPCTVVVPLSTKPMMVQKLRDAGATEVIQHGASWYEADTYLREKFIEAPDQRPIHSKGQEPASPDVGVNDEAHVKNIYVPPFDHPLIWEGNATLISELTAQLPPREAGEHATRFPADVVVCSVGGGGLFNGVMRGLEKHLHEHPHPDGAEDVNILAVETKGADSLAYSLRKEMLQSLAAITSLATSLGALRVAPQTFQNARSPPTGVHVTSVVASDAEAARGVVQLADETRLLVELACGVSVDVATGVRLKEAVQGLSPSSRVVVIVCGGSNIAPEAVAEYRHRLKYGWDNPPRADQK